MNRLPLHILALVLVFGCARKEKRTEKKKSAQHAAHKERRARPGESHRTVMPPTKAAVTKAAMKPAVMKAAPKAPPPPAKKVEQNVALTLYANHPAPSRESQALLTALKHDLIPGVPVNLRRLLKKHLYRDDLKKLPQGSLKIRYLSPLRDKGSMLYAIALEMMGKTMDESTTNSRGEVVIHILYPERQSKSSKLRLRFATVTQKQYRDAYEKPRLAMISKMLKENRAKAAESAAKTGAPPKAPTKLPATAPKSTEDKVTFDKEYAAPTAQSEKLLTGVLPLLKPQKKVAIARLLKNHLSEEQRDLSFEGACDIAFVAPLKDAAGKLVAVSFFVLPHRFLKKPKKGFVLPYLITLYPAQTGPGNKLELRIHEEECSGRYIKNIKAMQPDPKKLGLLVLSVSGSGYDEVKMDRYALVPLQTFFIWHKGVMQGTMSKVLVKKDADKEAGCSSVGKASHSWYKSKKSGVMLIETEREQSICKDGGKLLYNCSQNATVYHITPSMQMHWIYKPADLKKLMAAEPALVPKLKTMDKESSTPCKP